ncbi:MAG: L-serine ammonia-lyase, iron-sulfur-dependent, subunit alpha [Desulfohalobiaceae bacterium]|nr:L-serine ammonia-lyase, iron-sulfur-dependent, subunit alpha [Desulfohalobiaceae bacterium]
MNLPVKEVLQALAFPALGCTEPAAAALAAAAASSLLRGSSIDTLHVTVDPNVFKNGLGVNIPGTGGRKGLDLAAALGALIALPEMKMQILQNVDARTLNRAQQLRDSGKVQVSLNREAAGLYIRCQVRSSADALAESIIQGAHDRIVHLSLNKEPLVHSPLLQTSRPSAESGPSSLESWLQEQSLFELFELTNDIDADDLDFLKQGVDMNLALAESGLKQRHGLGIGRSLQELSRKGLLAEDMALKAKILTAAAADARMAGVDLPAMSSAGSGNNGLAAILPIWAVHDFLGCSETEALTAIGLSHLITAMIKTHTGKLSAICSCSIAAGAGAAAGITRLLGGGGQEISAAVNNLIADLGGILCDGAKPGCALKLATASGSAVQSALLAFSGSAISAPEGFQGDSAEQTIRNLGRISQKGMLVTDRTILDIMLDKQEQENDSNH